MRIHGIEQGGLTQTGFSFRRGDRPFSTHPTTDVPLPNKAHERAVLIDQWRNAPAIVDVYEEGIVELSTGQKYDYPSGRTLRILDEPVMDTCERPWAEAIVTQAVNALERSSPRRLRILERGFGLALSATSAIRHLLAEEIRLKRFGDPKKIPPDPAIYTVIELNKQVAEYARDTWKANVEKLISQMGHTFEFQPNIRIEIIEGDAQEETKKLIRQRRRFDIIISDTYPLADDEKGINDLLDADLQETLLVEGGVLAAFTFTPDSPRILNEKQKALLDRYGNFQQTEAPVRPHRGYEYLFTKDGEPILALPVFTCNKQPVKGIYYSFINK